ncbi:2Fe-2S iron-sulfur cluster binding domain-containing protein [Modestobacter sp. I12A-02628]|uniref:Oxidoreductase n=1 Tax=Goekera deserti TaxID=2497753 RepID=A0A7K3WC79_9ACTN|nr:PDR/VanB family oxidoreductase [Goekera deserti]MPQ98837.1 2Fe-2S iron-sulfur cluster binding domain-containing protein [Goekera deserti]NDI49664.1 2Fe-2S iron-sulfur cluster binding domain-containing protein [Goekera deserti]NEL53143.1 oxidoreductase [Goekera deserti]
MHSTHDEVDLRLRVARRTTGAEGVAVLELRDPSGADLPGWAPGAHVDLLLPGGLTRQYSLCGDPADRSSWQLGVLREPAGRGGSAYVHDELLEGTEVDVRGPRNNFPLVPSPRYVFIAGGIGITPIIPMAAAAEQAGAEWEFHYGGRSRTSMAFLDALDAAHGDRVTLHPQDEVGLIDLDRLLGTPRPDTLVYCCGPEPLLTAVEQRCAAWPAGSLHVERFSPKDVGEPVLTGAFEVELATSGRTLTVGPDTSILEAVEEAGVPVLSSCQEGTCGTCETTVLEGVVDHRDSLLTPEEQAANDTMFICVSRSAGGRLVLEL